MSSNTNVHRDIAEIVHDEMIMKDRIANILSNGPNTIPEIAEAMGYPSHEVVIWLFAMRRYGEVEAVGKPNVNGYFKYRLVEQQDKDA